MLDHPFRDPPAPGTLLEVADGVLWTRLDLPFRLDHVNIHLLRDDDGWVVMDAGIANRETKAAWESLLNGALAGERITGLLVTHHHPDHIGLAGWLCEKLEIPLMTSRTAYLSSNFLYNSPDLMAASDYSRFYASHGMPDEIAALVSTQGHDYLRMMSEPPFTYRRLAHGDTLTIGGRDFRVMCGDGHCAEQVMLHLPEAKLFFAADQVIEKISPNISVMAYEPEGDPLGGFLRSLDDIRQDVPDDSLVLAGHRLPFYGLHERIEELKSHHRQRLQAITDAARCQAVSAADVIPLLFHRAMSPHEMSFAFSEALAHMNHLSAGGMAVWQTDETGHRRLRAVAGALLP